MYENEKELLKKLCQKTNSARQAALAEVLFDRGVRYENWGDMALVVPSAVENPIVLCAHYDVVEGSLGYNDNGMALVTVLSLLDRLPRNVEVVFTNGEEKMGLGAAYYLKHTEKHIEGCVNLDVVGCYDQIYLDPMNCVQAQTLVNCKQGQMPFNDAYVFAAANIPSVCFSSGPGNMPFRIGIMAIGSTLHNNCNDNKFELLNFEMIEKVSAEVKKALDLMSA